MSDLLAGLNPAQRQAAGHVGGPLLIIAGAGSGKTRTLTHRIAHLVLDRGVPASSILAVTFTNKAANEMKARIAALVGPAARAMWVGTFHSICARLLRIHAAQVGLQRDFSIFDEDDKNAVLKRLLTKQNLDPTRFPPKTIGWQISEWKNDLRSPAAAADAARQGYNPVTRLAAELYGEYQQQLQANNAADFDDLIRLGVELLTVPEVRDELQERFCEILVDEYQDINLAQYELVRTLAAKHRRLCVVGDDDQSIYGWRGAKLEIILRFDEDFEGATVVKLEQNYRSTQAVLDVANALISQNLGRRPKRLVTDRSGGSPVRLRIAGNEFDEAFFVADEVLKNVRRGRQFRDHAVLYRTNAMSRNFEQTFQTKQVPYRLIGGVRFYDRKEIRDLVAYLRCLANPADDISLLRIINTPARGIGGKTVEQLRAAAEKRQVSLATLVAAAAVDPELLGSGPRGKVAAFANLLADLQRQAASLGVVELIEAILQQSGYADALLEENSLEAAARYDNVQELKNAAAQAAAEGAADLSAFLERVALVSDTDNLDADADAVVLMTLHSAKGLEFPVVFLVGLEEGLCPHQRSLETPEGIEEERRLCYVGITRAEEQLFLTHTFRRTVNGQTLLVRPSRFLAELPPNLVKGAKAAAQPAEPRLASRSLDTLPARIAEQRRPAARPTSAAPAAFQAGDKVRHEHFGDGIVVNCTGGPNAEVQVAFLKAGIKKLLVELCRLEKVGGSS
ncbi:MAG: UvrD-helicase domain-containing protein [Fimbriimonadaceae bacterium]|nr:UvrD-helicase domain-containing protein [Fimbriimonadaceae bacterium]